MKKLILAALLVAATSACAEKINYDADYIYKEALQCNLTPLHAIEAACEKEKRAGLEHQPGCKSQASVRWYNAEAKLGWGARYKPLPACK